MWGFFGSVSQTHECLGQIILCLFLGLGWNSWLIMISLACWDRYIASGGLQESQEPVNLQWIWSFLIMNLSDETFGKSLLQFHVSCKLIMIIVLIIWISVLAPLHGKTYSFLLSHRSESLMTSPLLGWHLAWYQMLISWVSLHFGCFCILVLSHIESFTYDRILKKSEYHVFAMILYK